MKKQILEHSTFTLEFVRDRARLFLPANQEFQRVHSDAVVARPSNYPSPDYQAIILISPLPAAKLTAAFAVSKYSSSFRSNTFMSSIPAIPLVQFN